MAVREGTRASKEFMCVSIAPDFCKSPNIVVPYSIISKFDCAVNFSTNVRFRKQWVFRHNSRLSTVLGDEAGLGGGVLSGVNKGFCRPIDGTSSKTVRANKSFVDYHEGTYMFMNCAGPDGQFNTIGRVIFLGNMLPGPVAPGTKVPKGCVEGSSSLLADIESKFGDLNDLIGKAKQLYALAKTDWSDPAAVLGAMGGLAGIAGLQDVAELAKKGKDLYELGKKLVKTDWSDPMQALSAVAGVANVAGMKDIAKAAGMATTVVNAIKTDWSDPRAALASATAIMKNTGLNQMVAEMASNAILDSNLPVSQTGTAPPLFPKPGSAGKDPGPGAGTKPATGKAGAPEGDASGAGKDGVLITTKQGNPAAAAAAIEAKARAANKKALEKAQAEERAKQEQAAKAKTQQNSAQPASVGKDESSSGDDVDLSGEGPMCKPSDAIVVGIGGTASGGPNTDDGHVEKLVRDYVTDDDKKLFLDGPDQMLPIGTGVAGSMQQLENQAYEFIVRQHELRPDIPIDIYGHSRGAYGALQLSARLGDAGIPVRNLGLYDPVDMALGYGGQESIPANVAHATVVRARDDDDGGPDQSREVFRRPPVLPNDPSATDYREYDSTGSHAAIGGNPGTAPLNDSGGHFSGPDAEANELGESRRSDEAVRTGARESGAQIKPREDYDTIGQDRRRDEESRRNMVPPKPGPIPG